MSHNVHHGLILINQGVVLALQLLAPRCIKVVLLNKWLLQCKQTYVTGKELGLQIGKKDF